MVALTIGLIILAAVSTLFVSSKKTYTSQDSMARLQENARFAMQFMMKDLRLAGYYGCISDITSDTVNNTIGTGFDTNALLFLEGMDNASGTWSPSGTTTATPSGMQAIPASLPPDAITIRMADPSSAALVTTAMSGGSGTITVNSTTGFSDNDVAMVSDCSSADIVQITVPNATAFNHATSLAKAYAPSTYSNSVNGTRVMKYMTRRYFIKTAPSGNPALYRQDSTASSSQVELVEGIENLQILYGKNTDGIVPKVPNVYLAAGAVGLQTQADWASVVSVRIGMLARTISNKETDVDTGSYDIDGTGLNNYVAPGDHYKRKVFQAVVFLRNAQ